MSGKTIVFISKHAIAGLTFSLGVAVGVGIKYPAGWYLSDGMLSMLGALIGAVATAMAVFIGFNLQRIVESSKENQLQIDIRKRIVRHLWPLLHDLEIFFDRIGNAEWRRKLAIDLSETAERMAKELHDSRLFNERLDISGIESLQVVITHIEAIVPMAKVSVRRAEAGAGLEDAEYIRVVREIHSVALKLLEELAGITAPTEVAYFKLKCP
ncbi:hypothetical protein EAH75_08320 [Rhodanobacter glycinis]|uniref:hypothetical protein n=1 Tax=Rhodanobacter glycinis TaxID=582702 RepID=UPI001127997A|nr:hypothetical protein [Rhodanobacter glycinis]TPG48458.1 hypothetical protein EAH75_08320 [Rhodanobacter glycinis]